MNEDKKLWFHRVSFNFWLPISWEGWVVFLGYIGGIALIYKLNADHWHETIRLKYHLPALLEFAVLTGLFYWITRGRVRR